VVASTKLSNNLKKKLHKFFKNNNPIQRKTTKKYLKRKLEIKNSN
jgi:hypothetical protein